MCPWNIHKKRPHISTQRKLSKVQPVQKSSPAHKWKKNRRKQSTTKALLTGIFLGNSWVKQGFKTETAELKLLRK